MACEATREARAISAGGGAAPPSVCVTAQRESWRRFLHGTVAPVARLVAHELGEKLDAPGLRLEFEELRASDVQSRARSWRTLVGKDAKFDTDRGIRDRGARVRAIDSDPWRRAAREDRSFDPLSNR